MRAAPALRSPRAIWKPASPNPIKPIAGPVTILISFPGHCLNYKPGPIQVQIDATVAESHLAGDQFSVIAGQQGHQRRQVFGLRALLSWGADTSPLLKQSHPLVPPIPLFVDILYAELLQLRA